VKKAIAILLVIGVALIAAGVVGVVLQEISEGPTLTYPLYTSVDGQGSISRTVSKVDVVTLTATPASGWSFDHWEGDVGGSQNPITITMSSSMTVTAFFTINRYTLSTSFTPSGSGNVSPGGGTYDAGMQVTLTAIPAAGWRFDYWSGDAIGTSKTVTITMDSSKSVAANFIVADGETTQ